MTEKYQISPRYVPCHFGNHLFLFDKGDRFGKIVCSAVEASILQAINTHHTLGEAWTEVAYINGLELGDSSAYEAYTSYVDRLINKGIITSGTTQQDILGECGKHYPQFVTLELTNFCNFQCTHCYKEANSSKATFMPIDLVKKIFNTLKGKAYSVELTGGEATAHPQFSEIVAMSNFPKLYLLTNGSNLENVADTTLKKLSHVQVSMYGQTDYEYRKYAKSCAFSAFLNGLKKLVKLNIPTTVAIILRKDNIPIVDEYLDLLFSIGIQNVRFGLSVKSGRNAYDETDWDVTLDQCNIAAKKVAEFAKRHPTMIIDTLDCSDEFKGTLPHDQKYTLSCNGGKSQICISESGLVRPCVMLPEQYFGKVSWDQYASIVERGLLVNYDSCIPDCVDDLRKTGRTLDTICPHGFKCK